MTYRKSSEQQYAIKRKNLRAEANRWPFHSLTNIPEAPRKASSDLTPTVDRIDVKRICENDVAVYVDGNGNVISQDIMDGGEWWSMPRLGTSKLRSEAIYGGRRSLSHPARMNPLWAQRMIQEYSKPGDTILDPMAGIGTTGIEAARLWRNAVLVDCDAKWANQMKGNAERLRRSGQMRGSIRTEKADARLLDLDSKVDAVMFSPPYDLSMNGAGFNRRPHGCVDSYAVGLRWNEAWKQREDAPDL